MHAIIALSLWMGLVISAAAAPGENHWVDSVTVSEDLAEARALIEAGRAAQALSILLPLAELDPSNADVHNLLGFAYRKSGDLSSSASAYRKALELDPNHLGALEYQGELFLTLGDVSRAEANLERLNKLCPTSCEEAEDLSEAIADWRSQAD